MVDNNKILEKTHKQDLLMSSLNIFYQNNKHLNYILNILNGNSKISLRIIDWFVTNYSKKFNIHYKLNNNTFNVYINYKLQLKGYSKKQFDPFCRRDRIEFYYNETEYIITTVGQLNFFRWTFINNIIDYIEQHLHIIEKDMNNSYKTIYNINNKVDNKRRKRHELSISAIRSITKNNVKIIVSFD